MRKDEYMVDMRPDQVAETMIYNDNSRHALYARLWELIDEKQWWSKLTDDQKAALNESAKNERKETRMLVKSLR